jgi:hypothetical protein
MLIRAGNAPMPDGIRGRLSPATARVGDAGVALLKENARALRTRRPPPDLGAFSDAIENYNAEIAALRREGAVRSLPGDAVGRLFTVGFGLEQMRQDLGDLHTRISEFAGLPNAESARA